MEVAQNEQTSVDAVVSIVKGEDKTVPSTPPSSPIKLKEPLSIGDELPLTEKEIPSAKGDVVAKSTDPDSSNAFPSFKPAWDISKGSPLKPVELSPEAALVEFISTSASFYNVKRQDMKNLELDILKVFTNNIMPANAAAWYMAKRNFYLDKPYSLQLLPYLIKHYPKKFQVKKNSVEFLEIFSKEVARKKMQYLVHQGLFAYFSHKADEYGVYFFDPMYYETTEPYHANLRLVTNSHATHHSKLIQTYFKIHKSQFQFTKHSPYLVSISKTKTETVVNTTGVIHSMINNMYGIVKFRNGAQTEKALFSAKSLYRDGYVYEYDPMSLPAIQFDGYKIPGDPKAEGKEYTWYAVLVWTGQKPSPKYCATKDSLSSSQFFQNQPVTFAQLSGLVAHSEPKVGPPPPVGRGQKLDDSMRIGKVVDIKKNGAVVVMHKNGDKKAFIPGWAHKVAKMEGTYLTTTLAVTLAMGDLIAFYIDPKQRAAPYYGVGCNVLVLKHANSGDAAVKVADDVAESKSKSRKKKGSKTTDDDSNSGEKGEVKRKQQRRFKSRRRSRLDLKASESSVDNRRNTEFSSEEIEEEEVELLKFEADLENNPEHENFLQEEKKKKALAEEALDDKEVQKPEWVEFLLSEEIEVSEDESDQNYIPPVGLYQELAAEKIAEASAAVVKEVDAQPEANSPVKEVDVQPEAQQNKLDQLLANSKLPLEEVVSMIAKPDKEPLEAEFAKLSIAPEADLAEVLIASEVGLPAETTAI